MLFTSLPWSRVVEIAAVTVAILAPPTQGITFTPVASPNLDLSQLGRVALAGDFDAISLYSYEGQNEDSFSTNGSQALLTQLPNGVFQTLVSSDGFIVSSCPFVRSNGQDVGVVIGGNFTQMGDVPAQGVALWNPNTNEISPLTGLNGSVNAVWCESDYDEVFVGGNFHGGNSMNAIVWLGKGEWTNTPFNGFDGPVNAIMRIPGSPSVLFAGSFSGLGNTSVPTQEDEQVVNLGTSSITAAGSSSQGGFDDPTNIVCKTSSQDTSGNTWLLADGAVGTWKVISNYGYEPTRLRLWNTHYQGRGTKTWRFTAFPINGIMNFTYIDPADGQNKSCDAQCPLSNNASVPYQDFFFVNVIGMNSFQIDISDWYGAGGGLDGIELVQQSNYVYAVSNFDEPTCSNSSFPSNATTTGPWTVTPSGQSIAEFLTADLQGPGVNSSSASVTFYPDLKQAGQYVVNVYTPGCQPQGTCASRGIANVTGQFSAGQPGTQMNIYQTNSFEKYDQLYMGTVDMPSSSFRPHVTLQPLNNQNNSISLVALRVQFQLMGATSTGLNGLYEYNPNIATIDPNFNDSAVNVAGTNLSKNAEITSLATVDDTMYIGGNFSTETFSNVFAFKNNQSISLAQGGVNDVVSAMISWGSLLFMGGNFTNTKTGGTSQAKGVVAYDTVSNSWLPLGGGVNGLVTALVPLELNVTAGQPENCITVNGQFTEVLPGANTKGFNTSDGFAVWVPGSNDWLQNLNIPQPAITGQLTYALNYTNITNGPTLLAGTISSQGMAIEDVVALSTNDGNASLTSLGLQEPSVAALGQNAALSLSPNISGAVTGLFVTDNNRNISIVGGNFETSATNGTTINNLAFISTASNATNIITGVAEGLNSNSTFLALARPSGSNTLYAGGIVTGTVNGNNVNGLIVWDLGASDYASVQPPAFTGSNVFVDSITIRPSSQDVYIGGDFDAAGPLACPGLCVYSNGQWQRPGQGFSGIVTTQMWQGNDNLLVGGNFSNGGNDTVLAGYDANSQTWSTPDNVNAIPGPVTVLTPANSDASQYWLAGTATNGSAYVMKYDGSNFRTIQSQFGNQTTIRGLSVLSLNQDHASNDLLDDHFVVLVTGSLNVPNFGNASAALFNGTAITPFILTNSGNGPGSISQLVSEKSQQFNTGGSHMALGFVVLIALAIALGLIFLLIVAGLLLERYRRRREGYRPAPQNYIEKTANMGRIPPDQLLGNLSRGNEGPRL